MSNTTENKNNTIDDTDYDYTMGEGVYDAIILCGLVNKLVSKKMKVPNNFLIDVKKNNIKFKGNDDYEDTCSYFNEKYEHHKEFKNEAKRLFADIECLYRGYKKSLKYISSNFKTHHEDTRLINEDGRELGKDLVEELKSLMMNKNNCPCFYYNVYRCQLELMDKELLHKNFKILRLDIKKENYDLSKQTYKIDKRDWYVIKVSGFGTHDVVLIKLFRDLFRGNAYFFCNEKNRDAMYEYLLK
jgi:hypothetical protein